MQKFPDQLASIIDLSEAERSAHCRDTWVLSDLRDYLGRGPDLPAAVVSPENTQQLSEVVRFCRAEKIPMIPYGAGSGVCGAIVSRNDAVVISTRKMQGLLSLDEENLLATFWSGTMGGDAERLVSEYGFTIGHWPQSIEISTVGGWLATRASGQYSTAYGNIEDVVFSLEAVLPDGSIYQSAQTPRASSGPDLRQMLMGSEGTLGIITQVTFSLRKHASASVSQAFAFADFATGLKCVKQLMTQGWRPPVVRLYDGRETHRHFEGISPKGHSMLIFLHEGEPEAVTAEQLGVYAICTGFNGRTADQGAVEQWFERRNEVPSFRSLIEQGLIVDTIEVGAVWSRIHAVYCAVMDAVAAVDHVIAVSAHLSHVYKSGANLYFTIAGAPDNAEQMEGVYLAFWQAAMQATMEAGGGIAHHHGIGRVRKDYMEKELGSTGLAVLRQIKFALDPDNLMNPGALIP